MITVLRIMFKKKLTLFLFIFSWLHCNYCWDDGKTKLFQHDFLFGVTSSDESFEDDLDIAIINDSLKELGVNFYIFSLNRNQVLNDRGYVKIIEQLLDELKQNKIIPIIILYQHGTHNHIDWTDINSVKIFENEAELYYQRFGDKVDTWITIASPNYICNENYVSYFECAKNVLIGHSKVWRLYKRISNNKADVGLSLSMDWYDRLTFNDDDTEAAKIYRQLKYGIFINPLLTKQGGFPKEVIKLVHSNSRKEGRDKSRMPTMTQEEIDLIRESVDFLGVDHFTTKQISKMATSQTGELRNMSIEADVHISVRKEWKKSDAGDVYNAPYGLYKLLIWLSQEYNYPKLLITANGWPSRSSSSLDDDRCAYLKGYLEALLLALHDGVEVIGYSFKSLFDATDSKNSESTEKRSYFGLYMLENSIKTAKKSAHLYKEIIKVRTVHDITPGSTTSGRNKEEL